MDTDNKIWTKSRTLLFVVALGSVIIFLMLGKLAEVQATVGDICDGPSGCAVGEWCDTDPCTGGQDCIPWPNGNCGLSCLYGTCRSGDWTCFPAGTKVLMAAPHTTSAGGQGYVEKNIEEVKVGDTVVSQSEEGKKTISTVTELDQPVRDHMCKIKFTNEESLKLTDEHPLFTQDGWKAINPKNTFKEVPDLPVTELKKGDKVIKSDGTKAEVESFACWSEKIQTYNLILDNGANTYFADGFLAHNKYVAETCPAGTHYENLYFIDYETKGVCNSMWPSYWGAYDDKECYETGKEKLGNLKLWCPCQKGACVENCTATAPTTTSVAANSGTSATVKWTPGTGGDSQRVYIGTDKPMVESNCPNGTGVGSGCVKKATGLPTTDTSYTVNNLSPGWLYYYRVVNFKETSCQAASPTVSAFSSCELIPAAVTLQIDQRAPLETQVSASPSSAISFVRWSEDTTYVSLNVHQDNSTPYTTRVTALAATNPTTTVTSEVLMPGDTIPDCTDTSLVTVSQPGPWVQAAGGDVYAAGLLESPLPKGISPREFVLDGSLGETPGVVTYGSNFDLAVETGGSDPKGRKLVSSSDWLVHETYTKVDYYDYFYRRFGAPTTPDYDHPAAPITQPTARATPYYVVGNMTTSGNWNVGNGKTLIFIVNGNLTISGKIKVTGRSFVSFIVNGHITVSPSVGSAYTSTAPDIEGVYITSSNKTFFTGTSQTAAKARLVLKGIFVAGNFTLQRDLSDVNQNDSTSAELFIYNPMYFITMPDKMKEVKIKWEEVAP